jgi:hypothetical protein
MPDTRTCNRCLIEKEFLEFNKIIWGIGLKSTCKACEEEIIEILKVKIDRPVIESEIIRREARLKKQREYNSMFSHSHKGKKWREEYKRLPEVKERRSQYDHSPLGKATIARYVNKRRSALEGLECSLTKDQWEKIVELQENKCVICNKEFTKKNPATKDHIIPVARAGPFTMENTQAVHKSCNSKKNAKIDKSNIVSWVARPDLCVNEMPY